MQEQPPINSGINPPERITEQQIFELWPELQEQTHLELRTAICSFAKEIQDKNINYFVKHRSYPCFPIVGSELLRFIAQFKDKCISQDHDFVKALLTLVLPQQENDNNPLISGFIIEFMLAYDLLVANQKLDFVKTTIKESAKSDLTISTDKVHWMSSACGALHIIARSKNLDEKYRTELLLLLFKIIEDSKLVVQYAIFRFAELVTDETITCLNLRLTTALTKHGFEGVTAFLWAIKPATVQRDKLVKDIFAVIEQYGFTNAANFYSFVHRNMKLCQELNLYEPLLLVAKRWGFTGFESLSELVNYLYFSDDHPAIAAPLISFWRAHCFDVVIAQGITCLSGLLEVIQSSVQNVGSEPDSKIDDELLKYDLLLEYIKVHGFKGVGAAYYDGEIHLNHAEIITRNRKMRPEAVPVKPTSTTTATRVSPERMKELNQLITRFQNKIKLTIAPESTAKKIAISSTVFAAAFDSPSFPTIPQQQQNTKEIGAAVVSNQPFNNLLPAQLYFLNKLQSLLVNAELMNVSISNLIDEAKMNTNMVFPGSDVMRGEVLTFTDALKSDQHVIGRLRNFLRHS